MHQTCDVCDAVIPPEERRCPACGRLVRPIWAAAWPEGKAESSPADIRPARPWGTRRIDPGAEFKPLPIIPESTVEPARSWRFLWVMLIGLVGAAAVLLHAAADDSSPIEPTEAVLPVAGDATGTMVAQAEGALPSPVATVATRASVQPTVVPDHGAASSHPMVEALEPRRALSSHEQEPALVVPTPRGDGTGGAVFGDDELPLPDERQGGLPGALPQSGEW